MADDKKKNVDEKKDDKAKTEAKPKAAPKSKKADKAAKGDIITLDLDTWVINQDGTEELFETTNEELAKSEDIHDEKAKYRPLTTIVGAGRVMAGLDSSLEGAEVGKKTIVEIPPSEGAGEWDARKVEIFPMRDFAKEEYQPYPGMEVSIKNKTGRIVTVMSGRVRVDFNLPMAGKTIRYEYTITNKASKPDEMALGIIAMDYGSSEDFLVWGSDDLMEITLPEICKYDQNWFIMKYRVVGDLREHTNFKSIRFIEEYIKKEEPKEDEPAEEEAKAEDKPKGDEKKEEEPKAKLKAKPKAKPKADKAEGEAKPKAKPKAKAKAKPKAKPKAKKTD